MRLSFMSERLGQRIAVRAMPSGDGRDDRFRLMKRMCSSKCSQHARRGQSIARKTPRHAGKAGCATKSSVAHMTSRRLNGPTSGLATIRQDLALLPECGPYRTGAGGDTA